jgi:hypothetical protein
MWLVIIISNGTEYLLYAKFYAEYDLILKERFI